MKILMPERHILVLITMSMVLATPVQSRAAELNTAPPSANQKDATSQQALALLIDKEKGVAPATPVAAPAVATTSWDPVKPGANDVFGVWRSVKPGAGKEAVKFKKVVVGDKDHIWALSDSNNIYKLTKNGWEARAKGLDVGVGSDGTAVGVNQDGSVYLFIPASKTQKSSWQLMPGAKLTSIAVGDKNEMWGTYKDTNATYLYHYTNGAWSKVKDQAGQDVTSFTQIALSGNTVFALKADGSVVKYGMDAVSPELINQVVADIQQKQQIVVQAWQDKKTGIKKGLKKQQKKLAAQRKKRLAKSAKKKNATVSRTPAQRRVIRTAGQAKKTGKKKSHKKAKSVSTVTVDSTSDEEAATR